MQYPPQPLSLALVGRHGVNVTPRSKLIAADSADQTLAAGATVSTVFDTSLTDTNHLATGGIDIQLAPDQALIIDEFQAFVEATDASGKIQITVALVQMKLSAGQGMGLATMPDGMYPFTFPPIITSFVLTPAFAPHVIFGTEIKDVHAGLRATFILTNTDGVTAHLYQRSLSMNYRIASGIDPTDNALFMRR